MLRPFLIFSGPWLLPHFLLKQLGVELASSVSKRASLSKVGREGDKAVMLSAEPDNPCFHSGPLPPPPHPGAPTGRASQGLAPTAFPGSPTWPLSLLPWSSEKRPEEAVITPGPPMPPRAAQCRAGGCGRQGCRSPSLWEPRGGRSPRSSVLLSPEVRQEKGEKSQGEQICYLVTRPTLPSERPISSQSS